MNRGLLAGAAAAGLAVIVAGTALLLPRPASTPAIAPPTEQIAKPPQAEDDRTQAPDEAEEADAPGVFDYYLLALSWSPSFCENAAAAAREPLQCGPERRYAFVVHGLWPQFERGYPENCPTAIEALPEPLARAQLDLMPSPALVARQWARHGACTGETPEAYFSAVRTFREKVRIPDDYRSLAAPLKTTGAAVEAAFVAANPGLDPEMIAVQCTRRKLRQVRICFTREGALRQCGADVRDQCGASEIVMPPTRASRA
jgi:ribonuclease T2